MVSTPTSHLSTTLGACSPWYHSLLVSGQGGAPGGVDGEDDVSLARAGHEGPDRQRLAHTMAGHLHTSQPASRLTFNAGLFLRYATGDAVLSTSEQGRARRTWMNCLV